MHSLSMLKGVMLCFLTFFVQPNQCENNGTSGEVFLLPRDTVSACPGERVTFMCFTVSTSVQWNVTVPITGNAHYHRIVSAQDMTEKVINISSANTSLIFSRSSDFESQFNSRLVITNVTNKVNGTEVRCYRDVDLQAITILHVIESGNQVHPLPLEYNKTEVFGPKTVTVFLEFEEESGIKYTASVLPQANSSSEGRGRIQLVLSYNTIYSVNITSTLCGQTSSSSTVILNYVRCFDKFKEVLVHSGDRDVYLDGTNITLACPLGKILTGHNTSTCIHGEWEPNPNETECKADCGVPWEKSNVIVIFNSTLEGSELTFWCDESPNDTETASCLSDGTWSVNFNQFTCSLHQESTVLISLVLPLVTASGIILIIALVATVIVTMIIRKRGWSSIRKLQLARDMNTTVHEYHVTRHQSATLPESEYSLVQHCSTSEEVQANSGMNYHDQRPNPGNKNLVYADITPRSLESQPCTSTLLRNDNYKVEYAQLNHFHHGGANIQTQTVEVQIQQEVGEPDSLLNLDSALIQLRPHVTTRWYAFGEAIGVEKKVLEKCQQYPPEESLIEVLDKWLRMDKHPTWQKIAEALKRIELRKLAFDIEKVYLTGMLPIQVDMNRIPDLETMVTDLEEELPPPVPPRCVKLDFS